MTFEMRRFTRSIACTGTCLLLLPWLSSDPLQASPADLDAAPGRAGCASWPGEPRPLPTVDDPSRGLSTWARERVGELGRLARVLEATNPIEAHRFWLHATCLDPDDPQLARQADRALPPSLHRVLGQERQSPSRAATGDATSIDAALIVAVTAPSRFVQTGTDLARVEVSEGGADQEGTASAAPAVEAQPTSTRSEEASAQAPREADASARRDVAARSAESAAPPPPEVAAAPTPEIIPEAARAELEAQAADAEPLRVAAVAPVTGRLLAAVDRNLELVDTLVAQARFRAALDAIPDLRLAVGTLPEGVERTQRAAQVELMTGTIQVALGDEAAARRHFRAALEADPALEIDDSQPPKVRRVFAAVKEDPS